MKKFYFWKGRQWGVTRWGIEKLDGKYDIQGNRVWDDGWERHLAEKGWCDMSDFREALRVARARWPKR